MVGEDFEFSLECVKVIQENKLPLTAIGGESSARIVKDLGLLQAYPGLVVSLESSPWNDAIFQTTTNSPYLLGLSCGLSKIIPHEVLENRFCINTHPSALPFNRGSHQSFWAIMDSTLGGGTLHVMSPKIDIGDIIFQETFQIPAEMNAQELQKKQLGVCINLLKLHLVDIFGGRFSRKAQVGGTYHNKNEIKRATTLLLGESILVSELLKLCRATCNKKNGFWIETPEGNFHISINSITFNQ